MTQLSTLLRLQDDLQRGSMGGSPAELKGEERIEFIRWNVLALEDELHEMLQEVGWKPWATSRHVDADRALNEMVDALHFFLNLLLALGQPDVDDPSFAAAFCEAYEAKNRRNAERQAEGYDGVAGKCPSCRRDLKEAGTTEHAGQTFCVACGSEVRDNPLVRLDRRT